jgi:hypothetical protein
MTTSPPPSFSNSQKTQMKKNKLKNHFNPHSFHGLTIFSIVVQNFGKKITIFYDTSQCQVLKKSQIFQAKKSTAQKNRDFSPHQQKIVDVINTDFQHLCLVDLT